MFYMQNITRTRMLKDVSKSLAKSKMRATSCVKVASLPAMAAGPGSWHAKHHICSEFE